MNIKDYQKVKEEMKERDINIQKLYIYDCLQNSIKALEKNYTDEEIEDMIEEVDYLWLEDENNTCISRICDCIIENYEEMQDMDKWEKLDLLVDF